MRGMSIRAVLKQVNPWWLARPLTDHLLADGQEGFGVYPCSWNRHTLNHRRKDRKKRAGCANTPIDEVFRLAVQRAHYRLCHIIYAEGIQWNTAPGHAPERWRRSTPLNGENAGRRLVGRRRALTLLFFLDGIYFVCKTIYLSKDEVKYGYSNYRRWFN